MKNWKWNESNYESYVIYVLVMETSISNVCTRLNSVYRVIRDESSFLKLYFIFSIVISLFFSGARPPRALFELSFEFSWKQTCGDNEVVHTRNERAWAGKKTGRCEKCLMWRTRREQWPPIFLAKLNPVTCESW